MKNKEKQTNNGITLIVLVIMIIILLILAGVSIIILTGENGILTKATEAKEETEIGDEQEKLKLSVIGAIAENSEGKITRTNLNKELTNYIGTDYTLSESEIPPFIVTYSNSGRSYLIDENGDVSKYVDISEYIEVGDYINYNPTVLDENGTQVEASKLTYTSSKGTGLLHGNGNSNQTFTAKADMKWRVLSVENGKVELISENTVTTDMNANFTMKGAIGYLYAEQELNEICKIYGYGYGADTSQVTEYDYGGPLDGELTGKITDSGARSITIEDINKKAGITEEDYGKLNSSYGSTIDFTTPIYYPTVKTTAGRSNSAGVKNLEYTSYSYLKSEIENMNIQNMLFNGSYWIASRCISINSFGGFGIRNVKEDTMYAYFICNGMPFDLDEISSTNFAIRPVVTLKSNVIDTSSSTEYNGETMWNLK